MQREAVEQAVRRLREHEASESAGIPKGQARGRIILPCGTGKTRISLRIVEELTPPGKLSVVLCPSIALVAQIRREYLQFRKRELRTLSVCSDSTAGHYRAEEKAPSLSDNPTADTGHVSASELKGLVTTDPGEISEWMRKDAGRGRISVIFGTYQSGHRIAEALRKAGREARVLIADEAHRTAGLRLRRRRSTGQADEEMKQLRDFTCCHHQDLFPARYRIYQTATPRIYDAKATVDARDKANWAVRSMDDVSVFGVELYRKSYVEAIENEWLCDYRIIALGVTDPAAYETANRLASSWTEDTRSAPTTADYLRGLALALVMGGAASSAQPGGIPPIRSCIAFTNSIRKSRAMAKGLAEDAVKNWVRDWMQVRKLGAKVRAYSLEHLDASSNVSKRDEAKRRLAAATADRPHAVVNVGIFGEGTDSPALNAVAFLEPRKSPIDVVQAVGRAMRRSPGKTLGYIVCPILFPPHADPETWLANADAPEGWQELGQILLALRAHDKRIEEDLGRLLHIHFPPDPEEETTLVAIPRADAAGKMEFSYFQHCGMPGSAPSAVAKVLTKGEAPENANMTPLPADHAWKDPAEEPTQIVAGHPGADGHLDIRQDTVVRKIPKAGEVRGRVDLDRSRKRAREMIAKERGRSITPQPPGPAPTPPDSPRIDEFARFVENSPLANAITLNLLTRSGLVGNRISRDVNLLEGGVREAAYHLDADNLKPVLDRHFGLNHLKASEAGADGCTIAALLLMNAAMLHQRIVAGGWLGGLKPLHDLKASPALLRNIQEQWTVIERHDFLPVLKPAVKVIKAIEDSGRLAGLERALHHLASEAARIAETYADMGADHAGPLFSRTMGRQKSDGAYFTRPPAASLLARLVLDVAGTDVNWADPEVWRDHKVLDPACGSGTLLAAMLTEMKRRARALGADDSQISGLQKVAVEEILIGMDINPVSLQLAASQLMSGTRDVRYEHMGLFEMPYGPRATDHDAAHAGSIELLSQRVVVSDSDLPISDAEIQAKQVKPGFSSIANEDFSEFDSAVSAARGARIVVMNPPFTNRVDMGVKFSSDIQRALRRRVDALQCTLEGRDSGYAGALGKNSIGPLFVAIADKYLNQDSGACGMVKPTIALSTTSGLRERALLASRFHIDTIVTCHRPGQINLSQDTSINESLLIMRRRDGGFVDRPTRIIGLDRFPLNDEEVQDLHERLKKCGCGTIPRGWGEISTWPTHRIQAGDWTAGIWRSPVLADAAARFAEESTLIDMEELGVRIHSTGPMLRGGKYLSADADTPGSFPILKSKGADGQRQILALPDEHWVANSSKRNRSRTLHRDTWTVGCNAPQDQILEKAGHLLISAGRRMNTGRLSAVAGNERYVGNGWMPATELSPGAAKALAVYLNSTMGRLLLMRSRGKTLDFPNYSQTEVARIRAPDVREPRIQAILEQSWELTRDEVVPQYCEGECDIRQIWDQAVCAAMGWETGRLDGLRQLLHREPCVSGAGYGQFRA